MPTHGVGSLRRLPRAIAITVGWPSSEISGTCREFDPQRAWAHLTPGSMALPRGGGFARSRAPLALLREQPAHNATYDSPSLRHIRRYALVDGASQSRDLPPTRRRSTIAACP